MNIVRRVHVAAWLLSLVMTPVAFAASNAERGNIGSRMAKLVYFEFAWELQSKNAYPVVTGAGSDVLCVEANIVMLCLNAPDTQSAAVARTFAVAAGEMTNVIERLDSQTAQVRARMVDRSEARSRSVMNLRGSVDNAVEAWAFRSAWARRLPNGLDNAHGVGKKSPQRCAVPSR